MFGWLKRKSPPTDTDSYRNGNTYLIELRNVIKTYQSAAGTFTALKGVNLQVGKGEFIAVVGKSGSGKSTMINMVTGIDRPTSGEVLIGDTAVHKLNEGQMAVWRGRNLGIIFQFFQLLPTLTVVENVMLPMDFCNMYRPSERKERAMALLEQVDMAQNAHKLPSAISGGQQQRVAIARALANDPPILIADEPTGNLDSKTANAVFQLFEQLVSQGKTIVMVTHDNDLARRATRSIIVADGAIVNPHVAQALDELTVDQLAWVSQQLQPQQFAPGTPIITQGAPAERFYIVTKGRADVFVEQPDGKSVRVTSMGTGQFFGEIGLLQGRPTIATVRAAGDEPIEVATIDRESFQQLVSESPATRETMVETAAARENENKALRRLEVAHA